MQTRMPSKSSQRNDRRLARVGRPCHRRRQQRKRQREQRVAEADQFQQAAEHGISGRMEVDNCRNGYCRCVARVIGLSGSRYNRQLINGAEPFYSPPHRGISALAIPNWSQIRETMKSTRSPISFTPW